MVTRSMSLQKQQEQEHKSPVDPYKSHYFPSATFSIYDIPLGRQEKINMPHRVLCKHLIATAMFYNGEIVETHARNTPVVIHNGKIDYRCFKTIGDWLDHHPNAETLFEWSRTEKIEIVHSHPNAVTVCTYKSKKGRK